MAVGHVSPQSQSCPEGSSSLSEDEVLKRFLNNEPFVVTSENLHKLNKALIRDDQQFAQESAKRGRSVEGD